MEGFSNPGTLEVRLLNAFVYLEMIDGKGTLDKGQLSTMFGISSANAEAIVRMRNTLLHQGPSLPAAIRIVRDEMRKYNSASIMEGLEQLQSPHGEFYSALMDLLSQHMLHLVGVPEELVHRNGHASFGRNGTQLILPDVDTADP